MTLKQLKDYLKKLMDKLQSGDKKFLHLHLRNLISVFPFNEYEYIIIYLRDKGIIRFEEYEQLRNSYVTANKYLDLYEISPRRFGQIWGEEHLRSIDSRFKKANKKLDNKYTGQYDAWFEGVKIEVKAARAISTKKSGSLVSRALDKSSTDSFWMNFQQIKPDSCDVFVFIGVWVSHIVYWVLSNQEVKNNPYLSHQHRGGIEYQIGITEKNIENFNKYLVPKSEIVKAILNKTK